MAKKPAPTFHPLAMAKSLERQNEAVGFLLAAIKSAEMFAEHGTEQQARTALHGLANQAEEVAKIVWPAEGQ